MREPILAFVHVVQFGCFTVFLLPIFKKKKKKTYTWPVVKLKMDASHHSLVHLSIKSIISTDGLAARNIVNASILIVVFNYLFLSSHPASVLPEHTKYL